MDAGGSVDPDYYYDYYYDNNPTNTTEYGDQGVDPVLASCLMAFVATISTIVQALALSTIRHNQKITKEVKMCFHMEHSCRILILLEHIFWGIPCGLWDVGSAVWLLDYIVTYLYYCEFFVICIVQLLVSCNRLLAIIFNGLYYQKVLVNARIKFILIILPPVVLYAPIFVNNWCLAMFDPYFFSFSVYPIARNRVLREYIFWYFFCVSFYLLVLLWVISTFIDGFVLIKVIVQFRSQTSHDKEIKLAIMTAINHSANALGVAAMCVASFVWIDSVTLFVLVTLVNHALYGVFGMNVLIFLRDKRPRAVQISKSGYTMAVVS